MSIYYGIKNYDNTETNEKLEKTAARIICLQEFSKKCLNWKLIISRLFKKIPVVLNTILTNYNLVLAGGFLLPNIDSFDLYYLEDNELPIQIILDFLRKSANFVEFNDFIQIQYECNDLIFSPSEKWQVILHKRVYKNLNHLLGSFNFDVCRVAFYKNILYRTIDNIISQNYVINFVNPNNFNFSSFKKIDKIENYNLYSEIRCGRYVFKNYENKQKQTIFTQYLGFIVDHNKPEFDNNKYLNDIMLCLCSENYKNIYYENNKIYVSFDNFWADFFEEKGREILFYNKYVYYFIDKKIMVNHKTDLSSFKNILKKRFDENYYQFLAINKNYKEDNLRLEEIYNFPRNVDLLKFHPEILILFVRIKQISCGKGFIKRLFNIIMKYYFEILCYCDSTGKVEKNYDSDSREKETEENNNFEDIMDFYNVLED